MGLSYVLGPADETEIVLEGSTEYIIFELAMESSAEKTRSCKNRLVQISSSTRRRPSEPTAQGEQPRDALAKCHFHCLAMKQ